MPRLGYEPASAVGVDAGPLPERDGERVIALEVVEEYGSLGVPAQRYVVAAGHGVVEHVGLQGEGLPGLLCECHGHALLCGGLGHKERLRHGLESLSGNRECVVAGVDVDGAFAVAVEAQAGIFGRVVCLRQRQRLVLQIVALYSGHGYSEPYRA